MGWAIGYSNGRDIGYGVPATCDSPDCKVKIDRGMACLCGEFQTDNCCGLYFCYKHLTYAENDDEGMSPQLCEPCAINWKLGDDWKSFAKTYDPKPDRKIWVRHKLTHSSWQQWRDENQDEVSDLVKLLSLIHI